MHLTGLRRFELTALRWRDVDLVDGILRVGESKSEDGRRSIALAPFLVDLLAAHKERSPFNRDGEPVFASRTGMTTAGHASMQTTKRYLHLAGTVFPGDAERLSSRSSSSRNFLPNFLPVSRHLR